MVLAVAAYTGSPPGYSQDLDAILVACDADEEQEGLDTSQHGEKAYHV